MKLERMVNNLELSKRLCDLGVEQESFFYWERQYLPTITTDWRLSIGHQYNEYISTFTANELLDKLPRLNDMPVNVTKNYDSSINKTLYYSYYIHLGLFSVPEENLSDTLANMLITVIERGLDK